MRSRSLYLGIAMCTVLTASCKKRERATSLRVRGPDAETRLGDFFEGRLESREQYIYFDYVACKPEYTPARYLALARYRILSSTLSEDTVHASVEVVTVAQQTEDPDASRGFVITQRVAIDTLHYRMTKDSHGQWGVCGYPDEGVDLMLQKPANPTDLKWIPDGASWQSIRHLADSLHRIG